MTTSFFKKFLAGIIFMICGICQAQSDFFMYAEPEFELNVDVPSRWSFNFGLGNRNLILEDENGKFDAQHIEITHFTSYEVGFYSKISLGLRYRFRETFDDSNHDEIRITQQYGRSRKFNLVKIAHRVRFEQRLRDETIFRSRYQFSVEFPLSGARVDQKEFYMVTDTEALWSLGKYEKPSLEQRFGISVGNEVSDKTKAELGVEFRLNDYTNNTVSELFIMAGISVSI